LGWQVGTVNSLGISLQLMPTSGLGISISSPFRLLTKSTNASSMLTTLGLGKKLPPS
jgi:hypothetical protein